MELQGVLHQVNEIENRSGKFETREFVLVVADNPDYPQYIKLEAHQENVHLLSDVGLGSLVKVNVNLRGRKYEKEGKTFYFNSLVAWSLEVLEAVDAPEQADGDDLPF